MTRAGRAGLRGQDHLRDARGLLWLQRAELGCAGPVARLVTQYRKFQIIQISNYTRMIHDGFMNADLSKEEKWVARKMLAYNLSTMFALGGTLGLPGAQAIGAILRGVFGDDDEPNDPELTMRKYLGDAGLEGVSDLLIKGAPAWMGIDVSGRLGAGNILSLFPSADIDKKSRARRSRATRRRLAPSSAGWRRSWRMAYRSSRTVTA